jgi:drug/metabolite transporter (DMT)-like permease
MSVALLPFNLFVYTHLAYGKKENAEGESIIEALDFETIFISLSVVLSAIILGLYTGYRYDGSVAHERANRLGICGLLLVIASVFMSSSGDDSKSRLWNQSGTFYMAVAAPCVAGLLISTLLARTVVRLSPPESVTIAIECCYQNTGIATSVAMTMFANADERAQAVAVPLFYGFVEAVVCGLYCVYMWKMGVRVNNSRHCFLLWLYNRCGWCGLLFHVYAHGLPHCLQQLIYILTTVDQGTAQRKVLHRHFQILRGETRR